MKCDLCARDAAFQVGAARHDKRKVNQIVSSVCEKHVTKALEYVAKQCFGTQLWACVLDMDRKLLYHSYDADQRGHSAVLGWEVR